MAKKPKKKKKPKDIPLSQRLQKKTNGEPKAFCTVIATDDGGSVASTTCGTLEQAVALYHGLGKVREDLGAHLLNAGLELSDLEPPIEHPGAG